MAVSGSKEFDVKADRATVMAALAAVERLPEWSSAHKSVTVESTYPDGRPQRVKMTISVVGITDEQVVDYTFEGDEKLSWTLVSGSQQKQQDGSYLLTAKDDGSTHVEFSLTVDPKIPVPGFLVKKAQKMALDTASKGLTKFLES